MPRKSLVHKWPRIDTIPPEARDAVDAYLTVAIASATQAHLSSRYASKEDPSGCFAANALYWKHARGVLRWLRGTIRRQRKIADEQRTANGAA